MTKNLKIKHIFSSFGKGIFFPLKLKVLSVIYFQFHKKIPLQLVFDVTFLNRKRASGEI